MCCNLGTIKIAELESKCRDLRNELLKKTDEMHELKSKLEKMSIGNDILC